MRILIEQLSFWSGVIAAILLASNIPISGWAYVMFLLSNVASLYLLRNTNAPKVIYQQNLAYLVINILGIIRWII